MHFIKLCTEAKCFDCSRVRPKALSLHETVVLYEDEPTTNPPVSTLGYPEPAVKWLHEDEPVSDSRRVTTKRDGDGLCLLVVTDVQPSDSGVYVCEASNGLGEATCTAKLWVEM